MPETLTYTGTLVITRCWCGIQLAVPRALWDHAQSDSKNHIHCPIGHTFVYRDNEATKLRAKLDQAEADAANQRRQKERAEAEAAANRGRLVRQQKRIANGICPCCNRSFSNLARHMGTQHPDFDPETIHIPRRTDPREDRVLAALDAWDGRTVPQLARWSKLTYQQTIQAVHRLDAAGLVTYQPRGVVTLVK